MNHKDFEFEDMRRNKAVNLNEAFAEVERLRNDRDYYLCKYAKLEAQLKQQVQDQRATYHCLVGVGNDVDELRSQLKTMNNPSATPAGLLPPDVNSHARQYLYNIAAVVKEHQKYYNEGGT